MIRRTGAIGEGVSSNLKTDACIRSHVADELALDPRLRAAPIRISVAEGVVTLSGVVESLTTRAAAERAAAAVHGVRNVTVLLAIVLPATDQRPDADIAYEVERALERHVHVHTAPATVYVRDRWVWLTGEVDWHFQRAAMNRTIHSLRGIKGVTNHVRLRSHPVPPDLGSRIESALLRDAELRECRILLSILEGVVALSGLVGSLAQRSRVEERVWMYRGVRDVRNDLGVDPKLC